MVIPANRVLLLCIEQATWGVWKCVAIWPMGRTKIRSCRCTKHFSSSICIFCGSNLNISRIGLSVKDFANSVA